MSRSTILQPAILGDEVSPEHHGENDHDRHRPAEPEVAQLVAQFVDLVEASGQHDDQRR
ncbi:MAG TPA: hypothetical protein VHJ54_01755 [Solirubrobacterales bacterium]|jgi:hypothetical protein|nr:hypothetical protein [Solirubrobacterales bacterium]